MPTFENQWSNKLSARHRQTKNPHKHRRHFIMLCLWGFNGAGKMIESVWAHTHIPYYYFIWFYVYLFCIYTAYIHCYYCCCTVSSLSFNSISFGAYEPKHWTKLNQLCDESAMVLWSPCASDHKLITDFWLALSMRCSASMPVRNPHWLLQNLIKTSLIVPVITVNCFHSSFEIYEFCCCSSCCCCVQCMEGNVERV